MAIKNFYELNSDELQALAKNNKFFREKLYSNYMDECWDEYLCDYSRWLDDDSFIIEDYCYDTKLRLKLDITIYSDFGYFINCVRRLARAIDRPELDDLLKQSESVFNNEDFERRIQWVDDFLHFVENDSEKWFKYETEHFDAEARVRYLSSLSMDSFRDIIEESTLVNTGTQQIILE